MMCHILYPILSYPILSYPILSYPILSYPILSYPILSYPILSYPILSYPILFYPILSYPILSYPILFTSDTLFFLVGKSAVGLPFVDIRLNASGGKNSECVTYCQYALEVWIEFI
jgi:hypothetical protein